MESLYRPRRWPSSRAVLMLGLEVLVLALAVWRLSDTLFPSSEPLGEPAAAGSLSARDVLPTPTVDHNIPPRLIVFPAASMSAPIIPADRSQGNWETRHLGDSVGHLAGTSWLDDSGGNIVLAGHVESATGTAWPFNHLFEAKPGDPVLLRDGEREAYFRVVAVDYTAPDDVGVVKQGGRRRLTLITCTDWDFETGTYQGRLVVVAEPVTGGPAP